MKKKIISSCKKKLYNKSEILRIRKPKPFNFNLKKKK